MIIKIFNQGSSDGSRHTDYLLNEDSHAGHRPEVLCGDVAITKAVMKSTTRKLKYTAGVISFKQGENLTELQQLTLIEDFKAAFAPFDDPARANFLFVRHRDKNRLELHWVVAKQDLKTGRSWSIFVPGKANLLLYEAFTRLQNYKYGFEQVDGKHMSVNDLTFYTRLFTDLHNKRKDYFAARYNTIRTKKRRHNHVTALRPAGPTHRSPYQENGGIRKLTELYRTSFGSQRARGHAAHEGANKYASNTHTHHEGAGKLESQCEQSSHPFRQWESELSNWRETGKQQHATTFTSPSLNTEDELRMLGIALTNCEKHEAPSIIERINYLKGVREREQYKPPRPS